MPVNPFDPSQFGFPIASPIFDYPSEARKEINEASLRIGGPKGFLLFWNHVLTEAEKEQLGGDVEACYERNTHSANLLCGLRNWIPERAVVEIAFSLGFLTNQSYSRLTRLVSGTHVDTFLTEDSHARPQWDRSTGRLEFRGDLCREIRRVSKATSIAPLLDRFQEANWPSCVEHEPCSIDPQRIHSVVRSLNTKLTGIRFRVNDNRICWDPLTVS